MIALIVAVLLNVWAVAFTFVIFYTDDRMILLARFALMAALGVPILASMAVLQADTSAILAICDAGASVILTVLAIRAHFTLMLGRIEPARLLGGAPREKQITPIVLTIGEHLKKHVLMLQNSLHFSFSTIYVHSV